MCIRFYRRTSTKQSNSYDYNKRFWKIAEYYWWNYSFLWYVFDDDECTKIVNELINNKNVTIKCNSFHIRIDLGDVELPKNHGMRRNIVFCDKELAYKDYENNEKYEEFEDSIEPIVTINGLNWISNYIPDVFII